MAVRRTVCGAKWMFSCWQLASGKTSRLDVEGTNIAGSRPCVTQGSRQGRRGRDQSKGTDFPKPGLLYYVLHESLLSRRRDVCGYLELAGTCKGKALGGRWCFGADVRLSVSTLELTSCGVEEQAV